MFDSTTNARGIIGSGNTNFDVGTINDKNVIYRNSAQKIIVGDTQTTFVNNIVIPDAISSGHAINLAQLNTKVNKSGDTMTGG
jgi:hypothetical protein